MANQEKELIFLSNYFNIKVTVVNLTGNLLEFLKEILELSRDYEKA